MPTLKLAIAQVNLYVGDIKKNVEKHLQQINLAKDKNVDLIVFPELSLTGYPSEDLLLRDAFLDEAEKAFKRILGESNGLTILLGHPYRKQKKIYNACSIIKDKKILSRYFKRCLPNYGVFDEARYFVPGENPCVFKIKDIPIGMVICEDLWHSYPSKETAKQGAKIIISPNASPFEFEKHERRLSILSKRAKETHLPFLYVNRMGGQDDLLFDGGSMLVNADGELCRYLTPFIEHTEYLEIDLTKKLKPNSPIVVPDRLERIYKALCLGLKDYVSKNNFPGVIIGVSGGIDSALTLAIAVDALGAEHVKAVFMPSRFTADISREDALSLTQNLNVSLDTLSIDENYQNFLATLSPVFKGEEKTITKENIQARIRAVMLMALSNQSGNLVLTTGNHSELAVGYCTLYGDMAGGYAVLKDVPKTMVYELANYRNSLKSVIPKRTIERPPTAELSYNQKDEDSLPPYAILDQIIEKYIIQSLSKEEIIAAGFDATTVSRVIHLIRKNEYKRRQAAVGTRINHKSFNRDWRYPITDGFES